MKNERQSKIENPMANCITFFLCTPEKLISGFPAWKPPRKELTEGAAKRGDLALSNLGPFAGLASQAISGQRLHLLNLTSCGLISPIR